MADDRTFFAGDLGTQHLGHDIAVKGVETPVAGRLLSVLHQRAVRSYKPITVVTLAAGNEADPWVSSPTFVLDPESHVVVR
jgi:hypothetical protein